MNLIRRLRPQSGQGDGRRHPGPAVRHPGDVLDADAAHARGGDPDAHDRDASGPAPARRKSSSEIVQEQEEQLKSVEGVRKMSSESMDSMGRITLEFPVGTDMQEAMLKVNTKLAQVPDYPEDAKEPVISTSNASDRPIAWFILEPRSVPPRTLPTSWRRSIPT